jgi:hypothetical protein
MRRTKTLNPTDLIPTAAVTAVTVWATVTNHLLVSIPGAVLSAVMIAVTIHPRHTLRTVAIRTNGVCRACGDPGSYGDPLTVLRRPQIHTRHVPAIRESHWVSRQAARDAREDGRWLDTPAAAAWAASERPAMDRAVAPIEIPDLDDIDPFGQDPRDAKDGAR